MKLLTFIFLLITFTTFAQQGNIFHIDSLPTEGVLLDKNWKFHKGDNPDFAKADFDDSAWESIDPTKDIFDLTQISKNGQIGWFRLRLSMDESLLNKQISLVIQQTGASEIYLNGLKIITNGIINTHEIIAKDPLLKPFPINLHDEKQQVIAVKFALQPNLLYTAIFENYNPAFWINVMDSEEAVVFHYSVTSKYLIFIFLIIGFSLMIFFIHSSFHLLYPSQKANLYFSLFALFLMLGSLSQYFYWLQPFQVSYKFYLGNLAFFFFIIGYFNLLKSAYLFLEIKKDFAYYLIAIFAIAAVILNAYPYNIGWKIGGPLLMLSVQINIARIAVKAVRKKLIGSWIITIGAFCTLILFSIFMSQGTFTNTSFLLSLPLKRMINYVLYCLSLPISTSLFLAFQFATISKGLKRKILENEALSTEKQEILSTQNETLEKQVTERTVELANKNRDLEIQAALERVRSSFMAMHNSNDLAEVIKVVNDQLQNLGLVFEATLFVSNSSDKGFSFWVKNVNHPLPAEIYVPYMDNTILNRIQDIITSKRDLVVDVFSFEDKNIFFQHLFDNTVFKHVPQERKNYVLNSKGLTHSAVAMKNISLFVYNYQLVPYTDTENAIIKRIAYSFEQAYVRFLDLQKAEAQAREAQIEIALERVRSKTLAMQSSNELSTIIGLIYSEMGRLNVQLQRCFFMIFNPENLGVTWWMASGESLDLGQGYFVQFSEHPPQLAYLKGWQERQETWRYLMQGEEKAAWDSFLFNETELSSLPSFIIDNMKSVKSAHLDASFNSFGCLTTGNEQPLNQEAFDLLIRFSKVFDQTYTRFLDLQKAEAQAREAQIELALERVRARTMAMQKSEELPKTSQILFQQMKELGEPSEQLTIGIVREAENIIEISATVHGDVLKKIYSHTIDEKYVMRKVFNAWKAKQKTLVIEIIGEELNAYNRYRNKLTGTEMFPTNLTDENRRIMYVAFFSKGMLAIGVTEPRPPESLQLLERFAAVFNLTYTRFLDLQKAEAQAREANIETALERVRSRTMAMQKSDELKDAAASLFKQVEALGIKTWTAGFNVWSKNNNAYVDYVTNPQGGFIEPYTVDTTQHPAFIEMSDAKKRGDEFLVRCQEGERLAETYKQLTKFGEEQFKAILNSGFQFPTKQYEHIVFGSEVSLMFITYEPFPEAHNIFKRFGKVFEQTYTRFLDLKKAEAQAREAQIELGLERVRARAMAMQNSEELKELIGTVFTELTKLDLRLVGCVIIIFDPLTKSSRWWMVNSETPAEPLSFFIKYHESLPYLEFIKAWEERQLRWEYVLKGDTKKEWDNVLFSETELANIPAEAIAGMRTPERILLSTSFNSFGCLNVGTIEPLTVEQFDMLLRFAKVFDLTYTRFNDLQKAEAQAREAQIEASFERIRASALAMQTSDEFLDVVKTLYEQINTLGQKELEATIIQFYHIEKGFINSWNALNTEGLTLDNITLGTKHIPFDACELTLEWLNAYKSTQDDYTIVAKGEKLKEWLLFLIKMSPEVKTRFGDSLPQISHYHFSKFSEGALSMVSQKPFSDESKYLLKRAASAFDLAYKRYHDLQLKEEQSLKLAQEKQRLEAALKELHATQNQLIQKEKLASLGELTAGIAHEIQNPLNFVNNFSELSMDLAKDLNEEMDKEPIDKELMKELMVDLSQNQEKINHHGKRASSIVKGMLEHSRATTGVKELTNINKLADEYLRLSYHGLRAKVKDFNADFKTEFDPTLLKIEVIPQDIGRVLLNLINNAFYAVNQRKQLLESSQLSNSYTPSVLVSTQQIDNQIIIKVKDNGIGMSEATKAKVFQPFFTTKPAGQGTGLGLSLAYDIVTKGHGGTLEVESTVANPDNGGEEVGSEFIIRLPID